LLGAFGGERAVALGPAAAVEVVAAPNADSTCANPFAGLDSAASAARSNIDAPRGGGCSALTAEADCGQNLFISIVVYKIG